MNEKGRCSEGGSKEATKQATCFPDTSGEGKVVWYARVAHVVRKQRLCFLGMSASWSVHHLRRSCRKGETHAKCRKASRASRGDWIERWRKPATRALSRI